MKTKTLKQAELIKSENYNNGDVVKAKANILLNHYAIFFKDIDGEAKLIHNTPLKSVVIDKWDDFFKEREFISIQKSLISGIELNKLMDKYNLLKVKKYNLFNYDCEDFISEITGNEIKIKQITKFINLSVIGTLLLISYFLTNRRNL